MKLKKIDYIIIYVFLLCIYIYILEPGYYKENEFGIRIEDIVQVVESETTINDFDGLGALEFYDITLAPIQTTLINIELLTAEEVIL